MVYGFVRDRETVHHLLSESRRPLGLWAACPCHPVAGLAGVSRIEGVAHDALQTNRPSKKDASARNPSRGPQNLSRIPRRSPPKVQSHPGSRRRRGK